jgi:uncharacterized protein YbjT (DUF2867 family)
MAQGLIAVTGATGGIGGRVARRLADRGVTQRLVVRDAGRAPSLPGAGVAVAGDFGDADAMREVLRGVHTLLLVSASEAADRLDRHRSAVDAAVAAGVQRVVYTSFLGAAPACTFTFGRDHWHTEQLLRASGLAYTFLRDNLYLDVLAHFVGEDGVIRGPAADGRVGAVARDDVADVAVAALLGAAHDGRTYDLTGPESLTFAEVAEELEAAAGRRIAYHPETMEEAYASRAQYGAPDWEVAGWVTTYAAVAAGELDVVTDAVAEVAGHPPMSLVDYLTANPPKHLMLS